MAVDRQRKFSAAAIFSGMKMKICANILGMLAAAAACLQTAARAGELGSTVITNAIATDTRYGLFNGLDHRSFYSQGDFPEPFLVDDTGLEINEVRLDWAHTKAGSQHSDTASAEVEKGFGLTTLELKVPYERDASPGQTSEGVGNLEVGASHPFYQFVSANGFFDTTFGGAAEVGIPVNSAVSKNTELVPKIFNDTKIGGHFTLQSLFGHSTLLGGGSDGGLQTFESGFVFGCTLQHGELPLPGVQQFIPMFELQGETPLNHAASGDTSVIGNACFRVNLKTIGRVQPRLGLGYVFPLNNDARADVHCGIVTSLVFEY